MTMHFLKGDLENNCYNSLYRCSFMLYALRKQNNAIMTTYYNV